MEPISDSSTQPPAASYVNATPTDSRRVEVNDGEEQGYYDTNLNWVPEGKLRTCARYVYPVAYKTYLFMDWVGGKVAYAIGANQSRFQYAVDEYYRQERKKARKEAVERQRRIDRERRAGMLAEEDESEGDDDEQELMEAGGSGGTSGKKRPHIPYVPPVLTSTTIIPGTDVEALAKLTNPSSSNPNNGSGSAPIE
jgi:hypothetical protein